MSTRLIFGYRVNSSCRLFLGFRRFGLFLGDFLALRFIQKAKGGGYTGRFQQDLVTVYRGIFKSDVVDVDQPAQMSDFVKEADGVLKIALDRDIDWDFRVEILKGFHTRTKQNNVEPGLLRLRRD